VSLTNFVIVAHPRTGSTYLKTKLQSHPKIVIYDEIFHPIDEVRAKMLGSVNLPGLSRNENAIDFLKQNIFRAYTTETQAVGFKLFYLHARNPQWSALRDYLRNQKTRVIHLKRYNRLDRFLSEKLSDKSGIWQLESGQQRPVHQALFINPSECFHDFATVERLEREEDELFATNPKIEVLYENMIANPKGEEQRILDFLEVDPVPLTTQLKKQVTEEKSQLIGNYVQLRMLVQEGAWSWANPEWLNYFD